MALHSAAALALHLRLFHRDRAYLCGHHDCLFFSASAAAVVQHRLQHSIQCPHCFIEFQVGAPYNTHIETHLEEQLKPGRKRRLALAALQVTLCLQLYTVTVLCFVCREGSPEVKKRKHGPSRRPAAGKMIKAPIEDAASSEYSYSSSDGDGSKSSFTIVTRQSTHIAADGGPSR